MSIIPFPTLMAWGILISFSRAFAKICSEPLSGFPLPYLLVINPDSPIFAYTNDTSFSIEAILLFEIYSIVEFNKSLAHSYSLLLISLLYLIAKFQSFNAVNIEKISTMPYKLFSIDCFSTSLSK